MNPILFLLAHLVGDYWLQSDYMALNKTKKTLPCLLHVLFYTACFLTLTLSWKALLFIGTTHFIIDRWPVIVKRMIWAKNHFPTMSYPAYKHCDATGYYDDSPFRPYVVKDEGICQFRQKHGEPRPFYITIWLYIISDNIIHLICNYIALTYLT